MRVGGNPDSKTLDQARPPRVPRETPSSDSSLRVPWHAAGNGKPCSPLKKIEHGGNGDLILIYPKP